MPSLNTTLITPLLITLLLLLPTTLRAQQPLERCPSFCRFRFCARVLREGNLIQPVDRVFILRPPNVPWGPFPCIQRKRGFLKALRHPTAGEARVAQERSRLPFVPISEYMNDTIRPSFPSNYFRFVQFPQTGRSTIIRRPSRGNQEHALDKLCVQLPIKSFRKLNNQLVFPKGRNACVAFRIRLAVLDIDFKWDSTNDFDIRLVEPDRNLITRFGSQNRSPSGGRLIADLGHRCRIVFGQERIVYLRSTTPQLGMYKIIVDNTRACVSSSKYSLMVSYQGKLIVNQTGVITASGEQVLTRRFTIP